MRPIITSLILSLFLSAGINVAYAERYKDNKGRERQEQRDKKRHNDKYSGNSMPRYGEKDKKRHKDKWQNDKRNGLHGWDYGKPGKRHDKYHIVDKRYSPVPYHNHGYCPVPPPAPIRYAPVPPPPPHLGHMVKHATRGCHDIEVWRIDYDTYIVRFRRGNRFYTQRIYPYIDRYGPRNMISVNWIPDNPWITIPSVSLNINL